MVKLVLIGSINRYYQTKISIISSESFFIKTYNSIDKHPIKHPYPCPLHFFINALNLFSSKQEIVMTTNNQKTQLQELIIQLNSLDKYGDTGYTANKAMQLIESAITIINQIHIKSKEKNQIKENTLTTLKIGYQNAKKYYMPSHGFDNKIFRNDKVLPCMYINKAYDSLEYFVHKIFNN